MILGVRKESFFVQGLIKNLRENLHHNDSCVIQYTRRFLERELAGSRYIFMEFYIPIQICYITIGKMKNLCRQIADRLYIKKRKNNSDEAY